VERIRGFCTNKIYILNYKNFQIQDFIEKNYSIKIIILKKYICIIDKHIEIAIYDIINYNFIKSIKEDISLTLKYDENNIFTMGEESFKNIILYDLSDINNIKYYKISNLMKEFKDKLFYSYHLNNLLGMFKYNDRQIILFFTQSLFIVELPKKIDFLPL